MGADTTMDPDYHVDEVALAIAYRGSALGSQKNKIPAV
jgi:hypothetical protein